MNYPAHLSSMWEKHLQPRTQDAPTVISTFAGCGGSSLGYSMAGYRELLAVEWDNHAVECFKRNFPDVPVYHGDIAKLSVADVLARTGVAVGELDVFDGSPPCQGFSTMGKRQLDDDRNQLFREFVRLLRGLQPKVFVMENVSGMVKGKMKLLFAEILKELKASGYQVSARLLNAKYFNVPQSRQRMIFVGVRNDLGIAPSHPRAQKKVIKVQIIDNKPAIYNVSRYGDVLLNFKKPSPTITKKIRLFCDVQNEIGIKSYQVNGSFPLDYTFLGSFSSVKDRVGNSVPPLFMEAIARHIRTELLSKSEQV